MDKDPKEYSELDRLRHSCAHVMAHAVKRLFPEARFGVGPAIANGFYYDMEVSRPITDEDLAVIEKEMARIIKEDRPFVRKALSRDEAKAHFAKENQSYKLEIIDQIGAADEISTYSEGDFTDLCRGPHIATAGAIKAFKLLSVAGAYWRGDERRPMMQRIYGTAFFSNKELEDHLKAIEEAKKRDHRKVGKELDFFSIQELSGPGLVLYHPKGGMLRYLIEKYVREEHLKRGYQFVQGPQILKSDVWKISGHYDYYKDNMFIHTAEDGKEYGIKPMNCPGHMLIYRTQTRSYREFPIRFFEMGSVCRNEKAGTLHGLLRVRNFTQDDAHIFCLPEQLEPEIASVLDFMFQVLKDFGFHEAEIILSLRPKDSIGSDEMWDRATRALRGALQSKGLAFKEEPEGGAFYGPKIDIRIKDALGRSWQCSTIQCDFALPEKFELEYVGASGRKERPVMLHRAILGSVERFMGTLLEHYAGALPFWLSPVQVAVLPVAKGHEEYCAQVTARLKAKGIRAELKTSEDTLGKRIREAQTEKTPFVLVAGDKEVGGRVAVRQRGVTDQKTMELEEFISECDNRIVHFQ